jgi:aspartate/methionine/tyrosine aminotransferase
MDSEFPTTRTPVGRSDSGPLLFLFSSVDGNRHKLDFGGHLRGGMEFPPFEHLRFYEGVHDVRLNISYSNIKGFTLGEFHRALPKDLDLNWTDERGPPELRQLIARRSGVTADRVLVTTGATEANFLANAALVQPGDRVIVDSPNYSPLRDCAAGFGAEVVPVARDCRGGWSLDLDRLRKAAADRAKLLVFANLNNPTSAPIGKSEFREITEIAQDCDGYVLVDETFRELAFDHVPPSVSDFGPRTIALSTVTKVGGLGALRVGWMIASPDLLKRFKAVKDYTTICGSSVSQLLALWALKRWDFFRRRAKRILDHNRKLAKEVLEKTPGLHGDVPIGGTVMFPHSDVDVPKLAQHLLRKYKTIIAEGRFFGTDDHFRIGLGGDPDELRTGLRNLQRAVREFAG